MAPRNATASASLSAALNACSNFLIKLATRERRAEVAWGELFRLRPGRLVSHRFPLASCSEAYRLIQEGPADLLQVVFTY